MEENTGKVPNEVLARETILKPKETKQYYELYNKVQDSKILTELTELRDNISKIKDIFKTDMAITGQNILDKVDLNTYELTDEEKQVKQEIEDIFGFISHIVDEFYDYSEKDFDKLIVK